MLITRRKFIVGCSTGIAALAGARLTGLTFAADAENSSSHNMLVLVFLRGGCDGLSLVGPVDDRFYAAARGIEIRILDNGANKGLPMANGLGGADFRFHPKASGLKELYDSRMLAIVHACGLTDGTRSHFDAMDLMERGVADHTQKNLSTGWLTRHLISAKRGGMLTAAAVSSSLPASLLGSSAAYSVMDTAGFTLYGGESQHQVLTRLYAGNTAVHEAGRHTLRALEVIGKKVQRDESGNIISYQPSINSNYMEGDLSNSLKTVAQIIKMDVGLQVATVDYGGWDTHEYQGAIFPTLTEELSRSLAAFWNDMSVFHNRLTVVVMSEFGRRLKSNESSGTDHGHGNLMMVLGGHIHGGKMYGKWPGLANEQLDSGADLAVTTDYRTVLSEILEHRLQNSNLKQIFPGFGPHQPLGLIHK